MTVFTDEQKKIIYRRCTSGSQPYGLVAKQFGVEKHQIIEVVKEIRIQEREFKNDTEHIPSEQLIIIKKLEIDLFELITEYQKATGIAKGMLSRRINELKFYYCKFKVA